MKRKMTHKSLLALFCVTVLLGTASTFLLGAAQTGSTGTKFKVTGIVATRNQPPAAPADQPASSTTPFNGIQYLGGPVMNNPHGTNVYFIWYGNWSSDHSEPRLASAPTTARLAPPGTPKIDGVGVKSGTTEISLAFS